MVSKIKESLDQIKAARQGQRRTDQYVVEEQPRIFDEVDDEKYREIVANRREDWVVGSKDLGYTDDGKEIWESTDAANSSTRQVLHARSGRDVPVSARALHQTNDFGAFQTGVAAEATTLKSACSEVRRQNELDEMLDEMCGSIGEAGVAHVVPTEDSAKRKCEDQLPMARTVRQKLEDQTAVAFDRVQVKSEPLGSHGSSILPDESLSELRKLVEQNDSNSKAVKREPNSSDDLTNHPILESDGSLWFYFMDAVEDERSSRLFLFGKVRSGRHDEPYQSCCLTVEKVQRTVYLLLDSSPQQEQDVSSELQDQAVRELKERCPRAKLVSHKLKWRNYAFEKPLPNGHLPFLKVKLENAERLPAGIKGNAFSHLFGGQASVLEQFVLKCRLKGPGWVRLKSASFTRPGTRSSFCSWEYEVSVTSFDVVKTVEDVQRAEQAGMPKTNPPLKVLSLNMQTAQRSEQHGHEPFVVAMTLHSAFDLESADGDRHLPTRGVGKWLGLRRLDTQPLPRDAEKLLASKGVQSFSSEVNLLLAVLTRVCDFDPDVIVGQNLYGFDLDVLASRLHANKIQCWQKFGRLRRPRQSVPRTDGRQGIGFWAGASLAAGRLLLDMNLQAKELLPRLTSYDLSMLAKEVLKVNAAGEVQPEVLLRSYDSSKGLMSLLEATLQNSLCLVQLTSRLQILPLTKQLTNLAGSFWNGSLQNKRAERNELLLCHEFQQRKFVLPDKEGYFARGKRKANETDEVTSGPRRQKAMYSGGLVLEPKVGLYEDFVMMLDFNSLYPSIIQEHNICFTTVDRPHEEEVANLTSEGELLARTLLPDGMATEGVLPQVLRRLVESRREVKAAMKSEKDDHKTKMLDIKQRALKLTANSMYGCLGFTNSRFHARPLAALITCKGREALQSTISIVTQELQLDVVYGDTDSIFVNSKLKDYDHSMQVAQQIKRAVNKRYKRLEIEVDGMFSRLLLLKKKRYAGVKVTEPGRQLEWELKGLDIVRRDWCGFAKDVGDSILKHILTSDSTDEPAHWVGTLLADKARELDAGTIPLHKFAITKSITKAPKDYPDAKHQPHVQVALRLMARGKAVTAGQDIPYIIAADTEDFKSSFAERARHPDEFNLDPTLKVDILWYKSQQIHPVVSRLLECVEGMDAARIAECLGLDSARYSKAAAVVSLPVDADLTSDVSSLIDRSLRWTKYTSCLEGLQRQDAAVTPWKDILSGLESSELLQSCGGPKQVQNMFVLRLRRLLQTYSEGWVTSNVACEKQAKTRRMRRSASDLNEQALLQELEYLEHICSQARSWESSEAQVAAAQMQALCHFLLESNGCFWVDCREVFASAKIHPK